MLRCLHVFCLSLLILLASVTGICGPQTSARPLRTQTAAQSSASLPEYRLPPEKLVRAKTLSRQGTALNIAGIVWSVAQLLLLLSCGAVGWMQTAAWRASERPVVQAMVFVGLLLAAGSVLDLPLHMIGHHLSVANGFSVQGWGSWFGDRAKSLMVSVVIAVPLAILLRLVLRASPGRWWLWGWAASIVVLLIGVVAAPVIVDPIFNHYEPLAASHPELVDQLERVVARAGVEIPPDRMFLMRASEKSTTMNAYVTGFGASKRVVVWDTTIAKAPPDEILFIFGHELGHYVLHHIAWGTAEGIFGLLPAFWLGQYLFAWLLRRYGRRWGAREPLDWASLAVLLLIFTVFSVASEPLDNALSRRVEHQADVFGQEAIHGLVADPQAVAVEDFQRLGEDTLDDPSPPRWVVLWLYNHPPVTDRLRFAAAYDPWVNGGRGLYLGR